MAPETNPDTQYVLDDVDRVVLYALQRDARNTTASEIAAEVGVSAITVRNRIANLENHGIIEGYNPKLDYEKAGFTLRTLFVATAPARDRNTLAKQALSVPGVIDVREMLTSQRNLYIEAIATNTSDLAEMTNNLTDLGLELLSSEIVANHYAQPFGELEF
ncbi:Lrp/AsnC family transcriptional regulator [Haladaptatus sp. YSMS36]|uniref:Lrp/AsnC family transcriptional regulator n=1 Tax=Haladaptatus sp. YSMS36 TaxID=3033384 RepID=UPI0023E7A1B0|nr:Lrp/AsnC family transcriptional regulator [Haladaptatus sp. YSMS36]